MVDHIREQHDDRELLGGGHTRLLASITAVALNSFEHQTSKDVSLFFIFERILFFIILRGREYPCWVLRSISHEGCSVGQRINFYRATLLQYKTHQVRVATIYSTAGLAQAIWTGLWVEFNTSTFQINNQRYRHCVRRSDVGRSQKSCLYFCLFACAESLIFWQFYMETKLWGNLIPAVSK